jgi:multiple sugar transport system substrate-binding protein
LSQVIADYQSSHPNVRINYVQQQYQDYAVRLQTAIAKQTGPDIFRYHASWVPMLKQQLSIMPSSVYSDVDYKNTFYPIAAKQLGSNGSYVGIPLEYDGLELFYNTEYLRTANVQPPTTWADMKKIATQLTVRDANGNKIQRAGLAIGNTSNVDHFSDILGLLLLQNGVNPANINVQASQDALTFYTSFFTQDKVWDSTFPDSVTAFARGDVAMIFAPSWRAHDIQAMNPNLKFAVAPVPQLTSNKVSWGSYWAEGVNAQSPHQAAAWDFLKYLSSSATMQKFYSDASKVRAFGEIYSRKDLAGNLATDPVVGAFVTDAPYAQNWYMNSATHDNGINDNIIKYYEDAINQSVNSNGGTSNNPFTTVQLGQSQILNQYGIHLSVPATGTSP